jgi:hypothetical protein
VTLEINEEQMTVLREVLDSALRDLRMEVAQTDLSRFKMELREREVTIRAILDLVGGPLPDAEPKQK